MLSAGASHADASARYAWSCPYRWVEDGIDMICETEFEHPLHFHRHPFRWVMVLLTGHAGRCPMHLTKLEQAIRLETSMRLPQKLEMVSVTMKVA